jgi:hypothetical protein
MPIFSRPGVVIIGADEYLAPPIEDVSTPPTGASKPSRAKPAKPAKPKPEATPEKPAGPTMSILGGATWFVDNSGTWYAAYKLPGSNTYVIFEASENQMTAIFGEDTRPQATKIPKLDSLIGRDNYYYGGNIGEVEGKGDFQAEVNRIIALAKDAGLVPPELDSPEIWDLIYLSQTENWTDQRLWNEIAKTPTFRRTYRGIEVFEAQGLNVREAVRAYNEYRAGLSALLRRYGYTNTEVTPQQMEQLLKRGHSIDDVHFVFNVFDHMRQNQRALTAFNEILVAQGRKPLNDDEMFRFLTGTAPTELYEIWESAQIREQAVAQGLEDYLTSQEVLQISAMTQGQLSSAQITASLREAASTILRYRRDIDLGRYGLDVDDIIDISLGLSPRSGKNVAEVEQSLQRALAEAQATGRQVSPFFGFTRFGRPQARSFGGLRVESL